MIFLKIIGIVYILLSFIGTLIAINEDRAYKHTFINSFKGTAEIIIMIFILNI